MKNDKKLFVGLLTLCLFSFPLLSRAAVVKVEKTGNEWRLLRNGKPYFVKGACVWGHDELKIFAPLAELASAGANSARTYHEGDAGSTLDRAQKLGLTVTLGFDVAPARNGTNFTDSKTLASMEKRLVDYVKQYKFHPALLAWGIGNEVELQTGDPQQRAAIFRALNRFARVVKQLDPAHPTVIVLAGIDAGKAALVSQLCPDVDIIGINAYAPLRSLPAQLKEWKFNRPYLVTEWGTDGHWESPHTSWKAPIELTSTQKAEQIETSYQKGVLSDKQHCLGSYAFLWGHKQEATATWFGLFLKTGERVSTQDALTKMWTGKRPRTPGPTISRIFMIEELDDNSRRVPLEMKFAPGSRTQVQVAASSTRPLKIDWLLARESDDRKSGGEAERAPEVFTEGISDSGTGKARITLPRMAGAYRVFVYVRDDKGMVATANLPFLIEKK